VSIHSPGAYNVGGLRTGSDGVLSFDVEVPQDGTYDLSVFANSYNLYDLVNHVSGGKGRGIPSQRIPSSATCIKSVMAAVDIGWQGH
jgi:hypothetical protein